MSKKGLTSLIFVLGADIKEFQTEMRKVTRDMEKWGKDVQKIGMNFSTYVTAPIVAFATGSVMSFRTLNEAMKQVDAGITSTGGAAGYTSEELRKMATELGKMSNTLNADILRDVTAQMLTFTNISRDTFRAASVAALDLSSRMNTDLKSASIMVGKALNDPIQGLTALSRVGIQFTEDQKTMIRTMMDVGDVAGAQAVILEELERQFGGSAAAAGDAFTAMKNSAQVLGQQFGELIFNAIAPLIENVTSVIEKISELDKGTQKIILIVGGFAAAIGPVMVSVGFMAKTMIPMFINGLVATRVAMLKLNAAMFANPIGIVAVAVAGLVASFYALNKMINSAYDAAYQTDTISNIDAAIKDLDKRIEDKKQHLKNIEKHSPQGKVAEDNRNRIRAMEQERNDLLQKRADLEEEQILRSIELGKQRAAEIKMKEAIAKIDGDAIKTTNELTTEVEKELGILGRLNEQLSYWRDMELQATTQEQINQSVDRQNEIESEIEKIRLLISLRKELSTGPKEAQSIGPGPVGAAKRDENNVFTGIVTSLDLIIEKAGIVKRELSDAAKEIVDSWNTFNYTLELSDQILNEMGNNAGAFLNEIGSALAGVGTNFKGVVSSMLDGFRQIINGALGVAIGNMMAGEAVKGLPGLITGAIGIGLIKGLWDKHVPKLAFGGIVPPGYNNDSYPALLQSGERIVPPAKLEMAGMSNMHLEMRMSKYDLVFAVKEGMRRGSDNFGF